jgi:hypothetical protein
VSKNLGANQMLALLRELKSTVEEFALREEKLNGGFHAKSKAQTKAFEAASLAHTRRASEAAVEAEADLQASKARAEAGFEQRKRRINQAHFNSRKGAMEEIRQQEARVQYKVQRGTVGAERNRESELARITSLHQETHARLAESREAFGVLETAARSAFLGYGRFQRLLAATPQKPATDLRSEKAVTPALSHPTAEGGCAVAEAREGSGNAIAERCPKEGHGDSLDEYQLLGQLDQLQAKTRDRLHRFRRRLLARVFGFFPIWLQILLLLLGAVFLFTVPDYLGWGEAFRRKIIIGSVTAWVVLAAVRQLAQRRAQPAAVEIANDLVQARRWHDACFESIDLSYQREQQRVRDEFESTTQRLDREWKSAVKASLDMLDARPREIDKHAPRVARKNEQQHARKLAQIECDYADRTARLRRVAEAESNRLTADHESRLAKLKAEHEAGWRELETEWKQRILPIYETLRTAEATAGQLFPEWQTPSWENWAPPLEFKNAAKFGRLDVDTSQLFESVPKDKRLSFPGPGRFVVPMLLSYPQEGSILFETTNAGAEEVLGTINNIIFRLLSTTPPGKLSFTIFDPVGLGQGFAGLMHLADYEESHINSRIWTQTGQLEEKLAELNEHMEKVIQMYLRNEYETIAEYNAHAGTIAEKYHFLVVADFPVNFSDTAARRLINIATSGARCGVYTLIHWDGRHALPPGFVPEELRKNSIRVVQTANEFELDHPLAGTRLTLDPPPSPEFATRFLHEVGELGKDTNRVEVPFAQVAPPDAECWSEDTTEELHVPIGRSGATKLQYLQIGKGTRQHALIAGKTGSGKSTLFHVIITNLALWCSPEQVEFYLVDFKKGVEFKCYANRRLPHARVVAIESDREFGLSVLQRVDEELRRRGDLFRKLGVQDLPGYKRAGGTEPMPRSLLIIDEFQEFFVEEDRVSQYAAVLLDRIVRQGRAFGIHVLLGSQTLGGAYTLARATIGQMVIRIALQCNEADAYLIMDQDNAAPRLLSRPGEGIYNDAAGSLEGNSPFQTVWLPEDERDGYLAKVRGRANQSANPPPGPFVFEGNAPGDVQENVPLRQALEASALKPAAQARVWLGSPNAIKGPTEAVFRRQSGNNLLIVGQSDERALTMLSVALVSLAAQHPKDTARFILLDSTPPGFPQREFLQRVVQAIPHEIIQINNSNLAKMLGTLVEELRQPAAGERVEARQTFVLIHGLQNYKKLRQEDEFSISSGDGGTEAQPAAALMNLISDGPARGLHVVVTCDTYNNVNRFLGRKALSEFEMRVLFQMSASDSASLIDAPDASTLGLNRALYYNDREGYMETFRPYALPGNEWIEQVAQRLQRLLRISTAP